MIPIEITTFWNLDSQTYLSITREIKVKMNLLYVSEASPVAVVKEVIRGHAILGSKSKVNTLWYSVSSVPFVNQICQLFLPFSTKKNY